MPLDDLVSALVEENRVFVDTLVLVGQLPVGCKTIPTMETIKTYDHLKGVELVELPVERSQVLLLIGADLATSLLPVDGHKDALWMEPDWPQL